MIAEPALDCCHLNDAGLDVLTKYIARNAVTLLAGTSASNRSAQELNTATSAKK